MATDCALAAFHRKLLAARRIADKKAPFAQDARQNIGHLEEAYKQTEQNEAA